jgi:hypothetical protein
VYWYQQQIEIIGERGRLWVSLNQGWHLWRDGEFSNGFTGWPQNDGEAQIALFQDLHRTLRGSPNEWRAFPTRAAVAAENADVMFACYASSILRKTVPLAAGLPANMMREVEQFIRQ